MSRHTFIFHIDKLKKYSTRGHAKGKVVPSIPGFYNNKHRRINRLDIKTKEDDNKNKQFKDEYIVIAIDSNGIKITNRGQWMDER